MLLLEQSINLRPTLYMCTVNASSQLRFSLVNIYSHSNQSINQSITGGLAYGTNYSQNSSDSSRSTLILVFFHGIASFVVCFSIIVSCQFLQFQTWSWCFDQSQHYHAESNEKTNIATGLTPHSEGAICFVFVGVSDWRIILSPIMLSNTSITWHIWRYS